MLVLLRLSARMEITIPLQVVLAVAVLVTRFAHTRMNILVVLVITLLYPVVQPLITTGSGK